MAELADPLLHLLVPAITLLALYDRAQIKWVITLLPFAILPDIDHINALYTLNRALLHNVFCLIPLILIALYGIKRKNNNLMHIGTIATFYLASHIILDLNHVSLLWPMSGNVFVLNADFISFGINGYATSLISVEYLLVFFLGLFVSIPNVSRSYLMLSKKDAGKPGSPILSETPIKTLTSTQRKREWISRRELANLTQVNRSVEDPRLQPKRS